MDKPEPKINPLPWVLHYDLRASFQLALGNSLQVSVRLLYESWSAIKFEFLDSSKVPLLMQNMNRH